MEGLEIQEFNLASILKHENIRLEAEFYTSQTELFSEYFLGKDIIKSCTYNSIYGMNAEGKGYPAIRMNEFDGLFTGKPTQFAHNFLLEDFKKHQLKENDILICRTNGNPNLVGKSALVMIDEPYVYESHLFKIQPKQEIINSHTLATYLNCKYGKQEIFRYSMQGNQSNFSLAKFKEMKIPKFSSALQKDIKILISSSFEKLQKSKEAYQAAQDLLLEHLDLKDFNPPTQTVNIKSFTDSFGTSGRLDAEFYQEKYDVLVQKLKAQEYDELKNLVSVKKSIEPGSSAYDEQGLPFIRVSDYDKFQISSPAKYLSEAYCRENHETLKNLLPKKGTILFSKDGTVGIAHLLSEDLSGITSGAILHLKVKDKRVLPEYLTLVLNSFAVQMQAERDVGGSIIQHWRVEEIKEVVIPIISMEIQTQIADLILQSDRLRQESQTLLEEAKRKVEQAIEG